MIETGEILQTMAMIQEQNFDIRTITLGINLLDCSHPSPEACAQRVYDKICRVAKDLVRTGEAIERELGIPIVNKRISVTPVSLICQGDPRPIAKALDRAAKEMGVNFLGGYSALMHKGATLADERLLVSIPEVLSTTERLCSSVNVGSTRAGINMNAVREMGEIIKKTAALTADTDGLGCAKLVVFCNAVEDNPFMAGASAAWASQNVPLMSACPDRAWSSARWKASRGSLLTWWRKPSRRRRSRLPAWVSWWHRKRRSG